MTIHQPKVRQGVLTIGPEGAVSNLASQVINVQLVPEVKTGDPVEVLSGEFAQGDREEKFTLEGEFLQDFGASLESVSEWLLTNRGKDYPFEFRPGTDSNKKITGTLTVEATAIGGDVGKNNTAKFEFSLVGPPNIGAAV